MAIPFPPTGPTGMTKVIPSYLYQEYSDDEALQAFIEAYNNAAQDVLDTLNDINLPIYTQDVIAGALLDWVGAGLYGLPRPPLSSQRQNIFGPFNTSVLNGNYFNGIKNITQTAVVYTTDDYYKRVLTWHLYKGDGKVVDVRWLKRRIMRFLYGVNGTDYKADATYQVSISFGTENNVSITLLTGLRTMVGGAVFNTFAMNTMPFNAVKMQYVPYSPLQDAEIFLDAAQTGAVELPFQYQYSIRIGVGGAVRLQNLVVVPPVHVPRYVVSGAIFNTFDLNGMPFNQLNTSNLPI